MQQLKLIVSCGVPTSDGYSAPTVSELEFVTDQVLSESIDLTSYIVMDTAAITFDGTCKIQDKEGDC